MKSTMSFWRVIWKIFTAPREDAMAAVQQYVAQNTSNKDEWPSGLLPFVCFKCWGTTWSRQYYSPPIGAEYGINLVEACRHCGSRMEWKFDTGLALDMELDKHKNKRGVEVVS